MAGLCLLHGQWDRAHEIAQSLSTPEGSFWHGIVHRREPDPGNASYWFRRVGNHPTYPLIREIVLGLLPRHSGVKFRLGAQWDPYAWIDYWELAHRSPGTASHHLALEIQRVEWEVLFDYCASPAHSHA